MEHHPPSDPIHTARSLLLSTHPPSFALAEGVLAAALDTDLEASGFSYVDFAGDAASLDARGAGGVVYRMVRDGGGPLYAAKVVKPEMHEGPPGGVRRPARDVALAEVGLALAATHPHVCPVTALASTTAGVEGGAGAAPAIVCPWAGGKDGVALIGSGWRSYALHAQLVSAYRLPDTLAVRSPPPLPAFPGAGNRASPGQSHSEPEVAFFTYQLLLSLSTMHSGPRVAHLDVKPDNVLITGGLLVDPFSPTLRLALSPQGELTVAHPGRPVEACDVLVEEPTPAALAAAYAALSARAARSGPQSSKIGGWLAEAVQLCPHTRPGYGPVTAARLLGNPSSGEDVLLHPSRLAFFPSLRLADFGKAQREVAVEGGAPDGDWLAGLDVLPPGGGCEASDTACAVLAADALAAARPRGEHPCFPVLVATGTPAYTSPECLFPVAGPGCPSHLRDGPSCDVWQVGVTVFSLLVGRLPVTCADAGTKRATLKLQQVGQLWLQLPLLQLSGPAISDDRLAGVTGLPASTVRAVRNEWAATSARLAAASGGRLLFATIPPTLSDSALSFLHALLVRKPSYRPSAAAALLHAWLSPLAARIVPPGGGGAAAVTTPPLVEQVPGAGKVCGKRSREGSPVGDETLVR